MSHLTHSSPSRLPSSLLMSGAIIQHRMSSILLRHHSTTASTASARLITNRPLASSSSSLLRLQSLCFCHQRRLHIASARRNEASVGASTISPSSSSSSSASTRAPLPPAPYRKPAPDKQIPSQKKKKKLAAMAASASTPPAHQYLSFFLYTSIPPDELPLLRDSLHTYLTSLSALGRIFIASEGINAQMSVPITRMSEFEGGIRRIHQGVFEKIDITLGEVVVQQQQSRDTISLSEVPDVTASPSSSSSSSSAIVPFTSLHIRIRHRLVADGLSDSVHSSMDLSDHGIPLTPEQWHSELQNRSPDSQVLDCRNWFESEIGRFDGATPMGTDLYSQTFEKLEKMLMEEEEKQNLSAASTGSTASTSAFPPATYIYCTGGIRCQKVGAYLRARKHRLPVKFLKGGINAYANYVEEKQKSPSSSSPSPFPASSTPFQSLYHGKNFVFDSRIKSGNRTVRLTPHVLGTCHQCGEAACDTHANCANLPCGVLFLQCEACREKYRHTCSDACATIVNAVQEGKIEFKHLPPHPGQQFYRRRVGVTATEDEMKNPWEEVAEQIRRGTFVIPTTETLITRPFSTTSNAAIPPASISEISHQNSLEQLREKLPVLEERLGRTFLDKELLINALTHRSYANEHFSELLSDNERLEFLGDSVLRHVVTQYLYNLLPHASLGELTQIRDRLVDATACAKYAKQLEIPKFLLLGKGEIMSGGRKKVSILGDTFEAVVGAIFIDRGLPSANSFLVRLIESTEDSDTILTIPRNHKAELQQYTQRRWQQLPVYTVTKERDTSTNFHVEVSAKDKLLGQGQGETKKEAEQRAAEAALTTLLLSESEIIPSEEKAEKEVSHASPNEVSNDTRIPLIQLRDKLPALEKSLGLTLTNPELLLNALTHGSFVNEHRVATKIVDNERLQFLGESALRHLVTEYVYNLLPQAKEGELTQIRSRLVDASIWAQCAHKLQIQDHVLVGKGVDHNQVSILAGTFQAIVGAILWDRGLSTVGLFIHTHFEEIARSVIEVSTRLHDFKSELQQYTQRTSRRLPVYTVVEESGPDHNKRFLVQVTLDDVMAGAGSGSTKREAEHRAAESALRKINVKNDEGVAPTNSTSISSSQPKVAPPLTLPIDAYCRRHSSPATSQSILDAITEQTHALMPDRANMLSEGIVGSLIYTLAKSVCYRPHEQHQRSVAVASPRQPRILELGMFTGYSTVWLLDALADHPNGRLISCELKEECIIVAQQCLKQHAGYEKLQIKAGPAMETLEEMVHNPDATVSTPASSSFDFIYLDANKKSYLSYIEFILANRLLASHGMIVLDNTLWKGHVANEEQRVNDSMTRNMHATNEALMKDKRIRVTMLPIRDGITIVQLR